MISGNPPDTLQTLSGKRFLDGSVKAGKLESLQFLYDKNGWEESFFPKVLESVRYAGSYYAVPLTVHRSNLFWYKTGGF